MCVKNILCYEQPHFIWLQNYSTKLRPSASGLVEGAYTLKYYTIIVPGRPAASLSSKSVCTLKGFTVKRGSGMTDSILIFLMYVTLVLYRKGW